MHAAFVPFQCSFSSFSWQTSIRNDQTILQVVQIGSNAARSMYRSILLFQFAILRRRSLNRVRMSLLVLFLMLLPFWPMANMIRDEQISWLFINRIARREDGFLIAFALVDRALAAKMSLSRIPPILPAI
jgi:hypothetical protein